MASITVRNVDEAVYQRLKMRAKANHRSLEAEARLALGMVPPVEGWIEEMRDFQNAMREKYGNLPNSTDIIREIRDAE